MVETLLSEREVAAKIGCSKSKVVCLRRDDKSFPVPARIGTAAKSPLRWRESEVDAWLDARFDARPAKSFTALSPDEYRSVMAKPI